ncbi:MAG: Unknown protein [uncultured Sulfurovum sp.]|uniref:DUF58 domain-containing protein n=1 Tax=uncultured Sulfurovum sp. TaxID=269237 RepID=A0A6S6UB15_9BACT|nr:MAG: Unknown protein [uncultured Sulfurovum sp.]
MNIKKILLKARKQVFGEMLGNNASLFQGEGFEFTELREYVYGDDVRKIDWKTTAKLGKPFIKIYREERELNVVTAVMMGGSTYFGTVKQKSDVMAELVALLGFSAVKNSDLFSNIIFADKLYEMSKPNKKYFAVQDAVTKMQNFDMLEKNSDYKAFTDTLYKRIKRKSLLFIISDFVGDVDLALLAKKHDVVALIVRDRFEENPQALGHMRLMDMEKKSSFEGMVGSTELKGYEKALRENDEKLYAHFKKSAVRYTKIYTDEEPYLKLAKLLGGR